MGVARPHGVGLALVGFWSGVHVEALAGLRTRRNTVSLTQRTLWFAQLARTGAHALALVIGADPVA